MTFLVKGDVPLAAAYDPIVDAGLLGHRVAEIEADLTLEYGLRWRASLAGFVR